MSAYDGAIVETLERLAAALGAVNANGEESDDSISQSFAKAAAAAERMAGALEVLARAADAKVNGVHRGQ